MKLLKRILTNSLLGFMALFIFNAVGSYAGVSAAINPVNIGAVGVLGIPGFALVLVLRYLSM